MIFDKQFIFITGAPRSGTSMITKIIDAHPDVTILMENIFENRRRHWFKVDFWNNDKSLCDQIEKVYGKFNESVVGNKVITPDVWAVEDIYRFCNFFKKYKIVFLVRDPVAVIKSRLKREPPEFLIEFNEAARRNLLLNFSTRINTYLSSWRQSVENYWKLKDAVGDRIRLIYYEDFCNDYDNQLTLLFDFLEMDLCPEAINWFAYPHHDADGNLQSDLKYTDNSVFKVDTVNEIPSELYESIKTIAKHYHYYLNREI
jgi:Sulfotransferase domain